MSSSVTINAVPLPPAVPTASSTIQPTWYAIRNDCSFDSSGVQFEWYNVSVLEYVLRAGSNDYTLYVRNTMLHVYYVIVITTINTVPLPPAVPTASATVQPTCATIRNNHNNNSIRS
jgi:hypothetical protein